eukprot:6551476-Alexandrium_andersonii.AAC.1
MAGEFFKSRARLGWGPSRSEQVQSVIRDARANHSGPQPGIARCCPALSRASICPRFMQRRGLVE